MWARAAWAAPILVLIACSPTGTAGQVVRTRLGIGTGVQDFAEPGSSCVFENVLVFDIPPKELGFCCCPFEHYRKRTFLIGSYGEVQFLERPIFVDGNISFWRKWRELSVHSHDGSARPPRIVHADTKSCFPFSSRYSNAFPDACRPYSDVGPLQIYYTYSGEGYLLPSDICRSASGFGGQCCVLHPCSHVAKLNEKQKSLAYANNDKTERKESRRVFRQPSPPSAWVAFGLLFFALGLGGGGTYLVCRLIGIWPDKEHSSREHGDRQKASQKQFGYSKTHGCPFAVKSPLILPVRVPAPQYTQGRISL